MPATIERQVAYKVWLSDLHSAQYVKQEGWDPNYVTIAGKQISRVHIVATVVGKFMADDGNYGTLTLDDGSDTIRVKAFGPDVKLVENSEVGKLVRFVGKVKEYNSEVYLSPEIAREVEPNWLIVHRLELGGVEPVSSDAVEEKIVDNEENVNAKLLALIKEKDAGDGAATTEVVDALGVELDVAKPKIAELLASGEIYEPKKGMLKLL